jgi:hypothetical protein
MGKVREVKLLTIGIQYRTAAELKQAMLEIESRTFAGEQTSKVIRNEYKFDYTMRYLKEFDYRIENINGNDCMVIPSRMNKK